MRTADRWYNRIVRDSRYNDRCAGRIIDTRIPYINTKVLFEFQNRQENKCYYCYVSLNWLERRTCKQGLTLERIDNKIPHYISNCRGLCCKSCNSRRYTRDQGMLRHYFSKWKHIALSVNPYKEEGRSASMTN